MNGAMKAILKTTKKHLNTITRNHLFNEETLTLYKYLTGRPITPLSDDINEFETLTPNYFLTRTANTNLLICPIEKPGDIANKRKWKAVQVSLTGY